MMSGRPWGGGVDRWRGVGGRRGEERGERVVVAVHINTTCNGRGARNEEFGACRAVHQVARKWGRTFLH